MHARVSSLLLFLVVLSTTFSVLQVDAFYGANSNVKVASTADDLEAMIKKNKGLMLVEFYAEWCGHCKNLAPEYEKAATLLTGAVRLVAIDADKNPAAASKFGVKGFPTLKLFKGPNDKKPEEYQGGRTAKDIQKTMMKKLQTWVNNKDGANSQYRKAEDKDAGDVVDLTGPAFEEHVVNGEGSLVWSVEFYAPWCGHCKALQPKYNEAATTIKSMYPNVRFGKINCDEDKSHCSKYGVQSFPTLKAIKGGELMEDYKGQREVSDLIQWAGDLSIKYGEAPEVFELTSPLSYDEVCSSKPVCFVAILPNILDTKRTGREEYLDKLQNAQKKLLKHGWGWSWTELGAHPRFEEYFSVSDSPMMIALSPKKLRFAKMMGQFSQEGIVSFARSLVSGTTKTQAANVNFEELFTTVMPWDGGDGEMIMWEDEFDLSDLDEL